MRYSFRGPIRAPSFTVAQASSTMLAPTGVVFSPLGIAAMQIRILRNECCGNGQCVEIAPAVFALDPHNKAMVLDADADTPEKLLEAAEACPCQAIEVLDDDGEIVFP